MHEAVLSSGAAQMTCDLQQIAGNCRRVAEGGHQNQFLAVTHKGDSPRLIVLIESLLTSISYMMLHGYLWTMMDMNQILLDPVGFLAGLWCQCAQENPTGCLALCNITKSAWNDEEKLVRRGIF